MTIDALNPSTRRFDIGGVLGAMGTAIGKNPVTFFGLSLLLLGVPTAILGGVQIFTMGEALRPGYQPRDWGEISRIMAMSGVALLVSLVTTNILQAGLTFGVVSSLRGRTASFQECLSVGLRYFLPALLIGICVGIGVFFGFLLLIVPGVILALGWCVAMPIAVTENKGVFESIGRSWQLTNGYKGQIFVLALIYIGISIVFQMLAGAIGVAFMAVSMQAYMLALQVVIAPLLASVAAVFQSLGAAWFCYVLRSVKEGVGAEELASVFA